MVATALTTALLSAKCLLAGPSTAEGGNRRFGAHSPPPGPDLAADLLHSSLLLSLEGDDGAPGDFLFTARPGASVELTIWHPDPQRQRALEAVTLANRLNLLADGGLPLSSPSGLLHSALQGGSDVRNLELFWRDDAGEPRTWLVSTMRQQPSRGQQAVVAGLVRDVSQARTFIDTVAQATLLTPGQIARNELLSTSMATSMRQQAHLISSICDLLGEQPLSAPGNAGCRRGDYVSDVRATVQELIESADLLRDYAHAEYGCLKLEPQRWQAGDIVARTLPGMKRMLQRHSIGLTHDGSGNGALIRADLPRLSRLLNLLACAIVPAITPGAWMDIRCTAAPQGGLVFSFIYQGTSLSEAQLAGAGGNSSSNAAEADGIARGITDLTHPALSGPFRKAMLLAHAASLQQQGKAAGQIQAVFLHLHDIRE